MFSCMQKSKFGMITVCANKDKLRKLIFLIIFSLTRNHWEKHEKTTAFNKNNKQKYSVLLSFFFSFFPTSFLLFYCLSWFLFYKTAKFISQIWVQPSFRQNKQKLPNKNRPKAQTSHLNLVHIFNFTEEVLSFKSNRKKGC